MVELQRQTGADIERFDVAEVYDGDFEATLDRVQKEREFGITPTLVPIKSDLPVLMDLYRESREIMLSCGDVNQWKPGYPTEDIVRGDIKSCNGYCIEDEGKIVGAFAFILGEDPTYRVIERGEWLDDSGVYGTIHRLGSFKSSRGIASACFDWCWGQIQNLRVDTHEDNVIMRHCIKKAGFRYCGVIHLLNGDPRLAYQKILF